MADSFNKAVSGQPIQDDTRSNGLKKVVDGVIGSRKEFEHLKGGLLLILAFIELMSSHAFKSKVCKANFIQSLSFMIEKCDNTRGSLLLEEFRRGLYLVAE